MYNVEGQKEEDRQHGAERTGHKGQNDAERERESGTGFVDETRNGACLHLQWRLQLLYRLLVLA